MRGFSLLETLVALAIIGVVLLSGLALLSLEAAAERRLEAHRRALGGLEAALEGVRAGLARPDECSEVPVVDQVIVGDEIDLCSEADRLDPDGLYHLRLVARYRVGPKIFERDLETLVWRP